MGVPREGRCLYRVPTLWHSVHPSQRAFVYTGAHARTHVRTHARMHTRTHARPRPTPTQTNAYLLYTSARMSGMSRRGWAEMLPMPPPKLSTLLPSSRRYTRPAKAPTCLRTRAVRAPKPVCASTRVTHGPRAGTSSKWCPHTLRLRAREDGALAGMQTAAASTLRLVQWPHHMQCSTTGDMGGLLPRLTSRHSCCAPLHWMDHHLTARYRGQRPGASNSVSGPCLAWRRRGNGQGVLVFQG